MKKSFKFPGSPLERGYFPFKGSAAFFYSAWGGLLLISAVAGFFHAPAVSAAEQVASPKPGSDKAAVSGSGGKSTKPPEPAEIKNPRYLDDGNTPLHNAVLAGRVAAALALIENGADVNAKNNFRQTPLHFAAYHGFKALVTALVERGSDIKVRDLNGRTPLHMTAIEDRSNSSIAVFLLLKGADVNAQDIFSFTTLHYASSSNYPDDGELASYLIEKGADINAKSNQGRTPLHEAAVADKVAAVRVLIESGADLDAKTADGSTPLHLAAAMGRPDSVSILLKKGADTNARNNAGETPLDVANRIAVSLSVNAKLRLDAKAVADVIEEFLKPNGNDSSSAPEDKQGDEINKAPKEEYLQP